MLSMPVCIVAVRIAQSMHSLCAVQSLSANSLEMDQQYIRLAAAPFNIPSQATEYEEQCV